MQSPHRVLQRLAGSQHGPALRPVCRPPVKKLRTCVGPQPAPAQQQQLHQQHDVVVYAGPSDRGGGRRGGGHGGGQHAGGGSDVGRDWGGQRSRGPSTGGRGRYGTDRYQKSTPRLWPRKPEVADDRDDHSSDGDDASDYDEEGGEYAAPSRLPQHRDITRSQLQGEALYGVFPVLNAVLAKRRPALHSLYVLSSLDLVARKDAAALRTLFAAAADAGLPRTPLSRHELNLLTNDRPHQGIVLDCAPLAWQPLDEFRPAADVLTPGVAPPVWLALDEVMDPQNLGAILRSAWCLGAAGVLASSKNCAPLSPAVSKASAGAMELAPLNAARNMQRTLQDAAAKGWAVLGAAGEAGAVDSAMVSVSTPTILVLGNEGYGLRTNIRRACTGLVKVHMGGGFAGMPRAAGTGGLSGRSAAGAGVDSLNVSVAAGVLLHDLLSSARL